MKPAIKVALIAISAILCLIALSNFEADSSQSEPVTDISTFDEMKTALESGKTDIFIHGDIRVEENITIPAGTTVTVSPGSKLLLPFEKTTDREYDFGDSKKYPVCHQSSSEDYCTVNLTNNGILINKGEITIGSVIGASKTFYYQGHTSSYHATLFNNNLIESVEGGVLKCYGYIKGNGTINSYPGTSVIEPLVITDFCGGDTLLNLYDSKQAIFNRYSLSNIQCQMTIFDNSKLSTMITMYIKDEFYNCTADFIGDENSLIHLAKGSIANFKYDSSKYLESESSLNIHKDIGKNTITLQGGAIFGAIETTINNSPIGDITLSMKDKPFSLPYNIDISLENGQYLLSNYYRILPGSTILVEKNAYLSINGTLEVYEGFHDIIFKGIEYPQPEVLESQGFTPTGKLILNGKLNLLNGSAFGGIIDGSEEDATIYVADGAEVSEHKIEYGCDHKYGILVGKTNNYSVRTLSARVLDPTGKLVELTPSTIFKLSKCNTNEITLYIQNYNNYEITTTISGGWEKVIAPYTTISISTDQIKIDKNLIENALSKITTVQHPKICINTEDTSTLTIDYDALQFILDKNGAIEWTCEKITLTLSEEALTGYCKDITINIGNFANTIQREKATDKSTFSVNITCNGMDKQLQNGLISYRIKSSVNEKELEKLQVWHIDEKGNLISFKATYDNDGIYFEAPLTGYFAISTDDIPVPKLDLSEKETYLIIGAAIAIAASIFVAAYWFKKRRGAKPLN